MNKSFSDQYKDPRWQKKRLEVMNESDLKCQRCKHKDRQLHVHHLSYAPGHKIWEYPTSNFVCLCEDCHTKIHYLTDEFKRIGKFFTDAWCVGSFYKRTYDISDLVKFMTMIACMDDENAVRASELFEKMAGIIELSKKRNDS